MSEREVTVVGGTVAALVAAEAAARAGRSVQLYLPRKGVGGGFAPLEVGGRRLERGIRLLELAYEGVGDPPPLADYDPDWDAHRPYTTLISAYVEALVGDALVEVERPLMWFDGRLAEEIHLSSDLSGLRRLLSDGEADAIAAEARAALEAAGHDAGILAPARSAELWECTLADASAENHGRTFHQRLVEPLCRKIRPEGSSDVLAALRRKLWMPIFWPRTVLEAASGAEVAWRPHRPMHTVSPGTTGEIVARLVARVESDPLVRVERIDGLAGVTRNGAGLKLDLGEAGVVHAQRPVLGVAAGELFSACGIDYAPDRVGSVLTWAEALDDDVLALPSMVHVVDPDVKLFRYTAGEPSSDGDSRILTCELSHDVAKENAHVAAREGLELLGIVREGAELAEVASFSGKTFTAPTAANLERFDAARAELRELELAAEIVGGAGAFGADSLNEQIVQGLRAAELAS